MARHLRSALASAISQHGEPLVSQPTPPTKAISFAPELVAAILAGRKTETRRLIRPQPRRTPSIATCPIARPGDLLYVREPWAEVDGRFVYAADGPFGVSKYKPAMFMPRRAARLTLDVTAVRPERLSALTPAAAQAEGAPTGHADPITWFARLWDRFFTQPGERWADDPFVWVITFRQKTADFSADKADRRR